MRPVRWVATQYVKPNSILAQRVPDKRGRTLLARGVVLTDSLIRRLIELGVRAVCIEDKATEDVVVREVVREDTKVRLFGMTYDTLHELAVTQFAPHVRAFQIRKMFTPVVEDVIDELRSTGAAADQLSTVYVQDGELFHHSVNVMFYAVTLGLKLGMNRQDLIDLGIGTLLHDVGKLRLDRKILQKPGRLTDEEFRIIQQHARIGYDILMKQGDISARSAVIALQHHERLDGTGYPDRLVGRDIHVFSQVTMVADVYEALTANRVYRRAFLPHDALAILENDTATGKLPKQVMEAFLTTVSLYPLGMSVRLSDGTLGVVVVPSARNRQYPVVRVIEDADGRPVEPYEIDLAASMDVHIVTCEA